MKKLFLIAVVLMSIFSSSAQKNNYVTFQAEIANRNGNKIFFISVVSAAVKTIKTIEVDKNGVFKDTLSVEMGTYFLSDGKQNIAVYLKNGFDLHMKMDAKNFNESVVYKGKGAVENNF